MSLCLVPVEGDRSPGLELETLLVAMWVLGTKPGPLQEQLALNYWASLQTPLIVELLTCFPHHEDVGGVLLPGASSKHTPYLLN